MTLAQFLDSADIDYVFVFTGWRDSENILYDGDYDGLVSSMYDKGLSGAEIMRWSITGRVAMIEVRAVGREGQEKSGIVNDG